MNKNGTLENSTNYACQILLVLEQSMNEMSLL